MKYADLPERWIRKLAVWISKLGHQEGVELSSVDFTVAQTHRILFDDESEALFRNAILREAPDLGETGVFTKEYGSHIFPLTGKYLAGIDE